MGGKSIVKLGLPIVVLFTVTLLGGCQNTKTNGYSTVSQKPELRLEIPEAIWETIFFREINKRAEQANLPSLRSMVLPNEDLEARFWVESGPFGMDAIVIRRTSGVWSGTHVHGISRKPNFKQYSESMRAPRSGWDTAWQRLTDAGLLTIPDASQVGCELVGKDVPAFVFETNANKTYRTYMYAHPTLLECKEAKRMLGLIKILDDEFGLQW